MLEKEQVKARYTDESIIISRPNDYEISGRIIIGPQEYGVFVSKQNEDGDILILRVRKDTGQEEFIDIEDDEEFDKVWSEWENFTDAQENAADSENT